MNPVVASSPAAAVPGLDQEEPEFTNERDIPQEDDGAAEADDRNPQEPPGQDAGHE